MSKFIELIVNQCLIVRVKPRAKHYRGHRGGNGFGLLYLPCKHPGILRTDLMELRATGIMKMEKIAESNDGDDDAAHLLWR